MKKLLFSAAALAVLFAACKDDDTNPTPQSTKLFLNMVSEFDSVSVAYNTSNRITKFDIVPTDSDNRSFFSEAEYENGRLVKIKSSEVSPDELLLSQSVDYNAAGQAIRIKFYNESGKMDKYDSLAYDNNGRLVALYASEGADGGITDLQFYVKYALVWDSKGNITKQHAIKITDGKETTDSVATSYTYDDKVNFAAKQIEFFLMEPESFAFTLSANNILTEKDEQGEYASVTTNTYTYDEDNYPVTMKSIYIDTHNGQETGREESNTKIRYIKK